MQKTVLLILVLLLAKKSFAQIGNDTITSNYRPALVEADKKLVEPTIQKMNNAAPSVAYQTKDFQWNTKKIARLLPPSRHNEPGLDTAFNPNYLRIGAGNYSHKLLEVYLANRANPKYAYNIAFQHLSADQKNTIRDFSDNRGFISGARFFKRSSLEARFHYMRDMNKYFGKDTLYANDFAKDFKKIGTNIGGNVLYDLKAADGKPGIAFGAFFNDYHNTLKQTETELGANLGWKVEPKMYKNFKTFGTLDFTYLKYRQNFVNTKQYFLDIKPRVFLKLKEYDFEGYAGINLTVAFGDSTIPYFAPYLYLEKKLEGFKMKVYGGLDGGLKINSIRRFAQTMPFTYDSLRIQNSFEAIKIYAGLKGKITENSQFNIEAGNSLSPIMPLVVSGSDSLNSLQLVYDQLNTLYFSADLRFSVGEKIRFNANGKVNNYTTQTELKAWNLPDFQYQVSAQYLMKKLLVFEAGVNGMTKRPNKTITDVVTKDASGFADLFLRVDLKIKNTFRLWVQGSNLLNNTYQYWYGYNNYGFTILGGLSASF